MPALAKLDSGPALEGAAVTPSDATELAVYARGLYIGVGGTVKVTTSAGSVLTFVGAQAGSVIPCSAKLVWATGTTATNIIALY